MGLISLLDRFAEVHLLPHSGVIVFISVIILVATFTTICYYARANRPLKKIFIIGLIVWIVILIVLTILTFASQSSSFSILD